MKEEFITEKSIDYELLDTGDGQKLERYGQIIVSRPDPQVIWSKSLPEEKWSEALFNYEQNGEKGKWKNKQNIPENWIVKLEGISFNIKPSLSKHLGVFPEQSVHWKYLQEKIKEELLKRNKVTVLNLFGYTGGSSLACAMAGAEVCHLDSSEFAVDLAMKNRDSSGLSDKPIRFIVDDVRKFVEREIKRGNKYDIILLDPPVYGKGSKKEIWKIEKDLPALLSRINKIISDNPIAIILNGYSSNYSHITYKQVLENYLIIKNGPFTSGELFIKDSSDKLLPCGIFAKWENK